MASSGLVAEGMANRFAGDAEAAEAAYAEALALCVDAGDAANAPVCLEGLAAAVAGSSPRRAARLLVAKIEGRPVEASFECDAEVIVRSSSGPAPKE